MICYTVWSQNQLRFKKNLRNLSARELPTNLVKSAQSGNVWEGYSYSYWNVGYMNN